MASIAFFEITVALLLSLQKWLETKKGKSAPR